MKLIIIINYKWINYKWLACKKDYCRDANTDATYDKPIEELNQLLHIGYNAKPKKTPNVDAPVEPVEEAQLGLLVGSNQLQGKIQKPDL